MNLKFAFSAGLAAITVTGMMGATAERDDERTKQEIATDTVCGGLNRVIAGIMGGERHSKQGLQGRRRPSSANTARVDTSDRLTSSARGHGASENTTGC